MKEESTAKNKAWKFKISKINLHKAENEKRNGVKFTIPKLHLRYRILLYFMMVLFAVLSIISVVTAYFPFAVEIALYVLAACTLFVGTYYLVQDIRHGITAAMHEIIRPKIAANPYTSKVAADDRFRTIVFAVPGFTSNIIFAVFNGIVGIISHSAWFGSMSAYYILLSVMRIGAVKQEKQLSVIEQPKERMEKEIEVYTRNSILFLVLAIVLAGMVVLLEFSTGGKNYPGFTIYAAAAYTFYKIIHSTIKLIKEGKRKSPLLMIIRKIGYIDACVSILTLQTAMFAAFATGQEEFVKLMNAITGMVVFLLVFGMGIQGIYYGKRGIKND